MNTKKARIRFACRRGMLELDILLSRIVDAELDSMSLADLNTFECLLHYTDPDLYAYLMGQERPDSLEVAHLVQRFRTQYFT